MKNYYLCSFIQSVFYSTLSGRECLRFSRQLLFDSLEDVLLFLKYNTDYQFECIKQVSILNREVKYGRNK